MTVGRVILRSPFSERVCDYACAGFALWTLCCHIVVSAGGTLEALLALIAVASCSWMGWVFWSRGRSMPSRFDALQEPSTTQRDRAFRMIQGTGLVAGLAGLLVYSRYENAVILWWWIVILLGVAAAWILCADAPRVTSPVRGRFLEATLWVLGLGCVVLTLVCHRFDPDDAFYVNVAVAAADLRGWPLLSTDTLHGIEGLPLHLPVYRVHSYELLNGALSYLTGIPAIYCFHWICASIAALFVPLVHAKLFRLLTPRRWLGAVAVLMFLLVAVGETHRWYGNFSFVRMWQGKSIFLFVFLPLIYAYAMRFALQPTWRGWLRLSAAQIAAVGATSSAIWAAPAGALLALICVLRPSREGLRTLLLGALASVYVLAIGRFMKTELGQLAILKPDAPRVDMLQALMTVLGDSRLLLFGICAILITWACCRPGLAQRFALAFPLAVSVTLLNPYAVQWVSKHVTGPSYWRSLWALPLPILMALLLLTPFELGRRRGQHTLGWLACLVASMAFAALIPRYAGTSYENEYLRLGFPTLKVQSESYRIADLLNRSVPSGAYVVAPPEINVWLPTFHDHAYALKVRHYLNPLRSILGDDDFRWRDQMVRYAVNPSGVENFDDAFLKGLEKFNVMGVCMRKKTRQIENGRMLLVQAGFHKLRDEPEYEIWAVDDVDGMVD